MIFREVLRSIFWREDLLPDYVREEILFPEHLVHQEPEPMHLVVVDRDEDRAVVGEQFPQQLQPRHHHAAPLVVPREVLPVHDLAEPVLHHRRVHPVVVGPSLVAGVVGRVDDDALHLAVVGGHQRLERGQIVAVDDQVVMEARSFG